MSSNLLSVDVGTDGCKARIFDVSGRSLGQSQHEYPVVVPQPSWAEQDAELWWKAVRKSISEATRSAKIENRQIACVCITGQSPVLLPVDRHGNPLMKALIWMDRRAVEQSEYVRQSTSLNDDSSMILPKILWVKEHRPQVFMKTHKFLQSADFVVYKLSGVLATDWINASTFHYDFRKRNWPDEALNKLRIPRAKLPEVVEPATIVGTVTKDASIETSLRRGTPVVAAGIDAYMAVVGVNAMNPGRVCEISGSSTCLMVPTAHKIHDSQGRIECQSFPIRPSFWVTWAIMSSTGASFRWFRDRFGYPRETYKHMDAEAARAPIGSAGLVFLPYLMGERSPIWNPNARGAFLGLSLNHSRKHLMRAILEGCAFGMRQNLEIIEDLGGEVKEIWSCGGMAKSKIAGQIKADVIGRPIVIPRETEAPSLGAAIAGAVGVNLYSSIRAAAREMVKAETRITPRKDNHKRYVHFFRMYKDAYSSLKEYFDTYHSQKGTHSK